MTARRIVLIDCNGSRYPYASANDHWCIDASGVPNANTQYPLQVAVEEQCNMGCWHIRSRHELDPWGSE